LEVLFLEQEKIMDLPCKNIDMEPSRYRMLFSLDNIYGIFRCRKGAGISAASPDCGLVSVKSHDCLTPYDVLKDILFLHRSAGIGIAGNDVICIRINGYVWSYRFLGIKDRQIENFMGNFVELKNFMAAEREAFINAAHDTNRVLSVLEGCLYDVRDIVHKCSSLYAIENEHFIEGRNGFIFSDCFLYMFNGTAVRAKNLCGRPFSMVKNALYYFMKEKQKDASAILLLNREELEMAADYSMLEQMAV